MKNAHKLKTFVLLITGLVCFNALAEQIRITDVRLEKNNRENRVVIKLDRALNDTANIEVRDNLIQLEIPQTIVWPRIEKVVSLGGSESDSKLMAYQYNPQTVRFRAVVPYNMNRYQADVSVFHRSNEIHLTFPRSREDLARQNNQGREVQVVAQASEPTRRSKKSDYDESYLEQLLKNRSQGGSDTSSDFDVLQASEDAKDTEDEVTITFAASDPFNSDASQARDNNFSFIGYIGKFAAFLGLVLVLFYGVVTILKKGVLRRGRLSLLNDTKVVEVLNTTYLGPKKSLMLVKVHKQVFLIASCEKGFEFLSEVRDVNGLFKEGEKEITGKNFDTQFSEGLSTQKEFKLKDEDHQKSLSDFLEQTAQNDQDQVSQSLVSKIEAGKLQNSATVRLSDQIKDKVRGLKSLQ